MIHYRSLATLALGALTTLSFAQNDPGDHARLPSGRAQTGASPPVMTHPPTTRSPVKLEPHGVTAAPGSTAQPHASPQPGVYPAGLHGTTRHSPVHGTAGYPVPNAHTAFEDQFSAQHVTLVHQIPTGTRTEHQLSSGRRVLESTLATPGHGTVHAVRYGRSVTGVVERPINKAGYLSRTYVRGGHILYARVYRQNTFQRFGHAFRYESLVPAVAFDTAYYAWAARPWSRPVRYRWRWAAEPWYAAYGGYFEPYPSYTSLDEWLTDYVIAQNLRNAYQTWQAENAPESGPANGQPPVAGGRPSQPAGDGPDSDSSDAGQRPYWESPDDGRRPYWEESSSEESQTQPKTSKASHSPSNSRTGPQGAQAAEASPPPLPADLKAELNTQIKQQLAERQTQATTSDTDAIPNSLNPGHTLFRVNAPLDVPSDVSGGFCSLAANDYIQRTGEMDENGTVPVQVKLSGISDCRTGLATRISVNDLEAMDNEQQESLTNALLAASKNMGASGLPQAPGAAPLLVAAGQTSPSLDATRTLRRLQ